MNAEIADIKPLLVRPNYGRRESEESNRSSNRSEKTKSLVIALKVFAGLISASAKIPSIPISLRLPYGPGFATASSLAYWQLEMWAANNIINDICTEPSDQLSLRQSSTCSKNIKKVVIFLSSTCIAIISLLPQGFAAAQYNSQPFKIPAALVTIISGAFFPLYSIQLSLNAIRLKKPSIIEAKLIRAKMILVALISHNKSLFIENENDAKIELIENFNASLTSSFFKEEMQQAFDILIKNTEFPPAQINLKDRLISALSYINGGILTATFLSVLAIYTYDQTKEQLSDNKAVCYTVAGLAAGSSLYLTGKAIIDTTKRAFQGICDLFQCKRKRSLAEQHAPFISLTSKVIAFLVDALSVGPTVVIFGKAFNQSELEKAYVQTTMSLSVFLMTLTATLDMVDSAIEIVLLSKGNEKAKEIIQLSRNYDRLSQLLNTCSPLDIALLLNKLSQKTKEEFLLKINLQKEELDNFLKDQTISEFDEADDARIPPSKI